MEKPFRILAALLLLAGCTPAPEFRPVSGQVTEQVVRLPTSGLREVEIRLWAPERPAAVVVFSVGAVAHPDKYHRIIDALTDNGFTVIAPVHDDAMARGDLAGSGGRDSFVARIEDLTIARSYAKTAYGDLPLVVMGHSFGSLMSSLSVGAFTPAGPRTDPDVKALIAFSSPGAIKGLSTPDTFRNLTTPVLVVTGESDVVQGFFTDWRSHRAIYDDSSVPGSALAVFRDGNHNLVIDSGEAQFAALKDLTHTFIKAHALKDKAAQVRLSQMNLSGAAIERR